MTSESNELDIPDFLEIKRERISVDKEDYRNFMLEAGKRVILATKMEPIQVTTQPISLNSQNHLFKIWLPTKMNWY